MTTVMWDGGFLTVTNCYNVGTVTASSVAGGFIGTINAPNGQELTLNVANSFNFGDVIVSSESNNVGSLFGRLYNPNISLMKMNITHVYSRPNVISANGAPISNQPVGWANASAKNIVDTLFPANSTFEDAKYTLEYSQSSAFATELGGAFKYAPGRTPKLAWEK
jgi:hypothetical protein